MFAVLDVRSDVPDTAWTSPVLVTVATDLLSELQVAYFVTSTVVLFESVAIEASCTVLGPEVRCNAADETLFATEDTDDVTTMTVMLAEAPPLVAVTVVVPAATAVMVPDELTVATPELALDHVAVEVTSELVPPTVTAVAVICFESGPEPLEETVERISAVPERVM